MIIGTAAECDHCKETTLDYMKDGWYVLRGSLTKYLMRKPDGQAVSLFMKDSGGNQEKHYCSSSCLEADPKAPICKAAKRLKEV